MRRTGSRWVRAAIGAKAVCVIGAALLFSCTGSTAEPAHPPRPGARVGTGTSLALPTEARLRSLRQVTDEGANTGADWSWDGKTLLIASKLAGGDCSRMRRVPLALGANSPLASAAQTPGAIADLHFFPTDRHVLFAAAPRSPVSCTAALAEPSGVLWPWYDYDLFKANADGSGWTRLTDSKGYDAEGAVCKTDGSILFTSERDGDLELYHMDQHGQNLRRLTRTPGYDGGASFNNDCTRLVWAAGRPKTPAQLADYQRPVARGLRSGSKLEIYVANADGSEATQVTYLNGMSFAPHFHPLHERIVFSSNALDPRGQEFDLLAIGENGTGLERITFAAGFDGFSTFSPDGTRLAFTSERNSRPGANEPQVFVAEWNEAGPPKTLPLAADAVHRDLELLTRLALQSGGEGGTQLTQVGDFIEQRLATLGLTHAANLSSFRQAFEVPVSLELAASTRLRVGGRELQKGQYVPLGFSQRQSRSSTKLVFADYGIVEPALQVDDYAGLDVRGKFVLLRRFVPEGPKFASLELARRHGDLQHKVQLAKERGAAGVLLVDDPAPPGGAPREWKPPAEASFPELTPAEPSTGPIPAILISREVGRPLIDKLKRRVGVAVELDLELVAQTQRALGVLGRVEAGVEVAQRLPGLVLVSAHLELPGNDVSGPAALLEVARELVQRRQRLRRDVVLAVFSAPEAGALGGSHYVDSVGAQAGGQDLYAVVNLGRVGGARDNRVQIAGAQTATQWVSLVQPACDSQRMECSLVGDGSARPNAQQPFFRSGTAALNFFTEGLSAGSVTNHTVVKVNVGGAARIARVVAELVTSLSRRAEPLSFNAGVSEPAPRGDLRSFNASLGVIPDYAGPGRGKRGVLLAEIQAGSAAELGGLLQGDLLVGLAGQEVRNIEDLLYVLNSSKPGQTVTAVVARGARRLELKVTFREAGARGAAARFR